MWRIVLTSVLVSAILAIGAAYPLTAPAQDDKLPSKADASCINCHADYPKTPNLFAGKIYDVSSKANTIQLQINKDMEIIHFNDATVLKNAPSFKEIPKQESVRIKYTIKDGKTVATQVEVKKGIEVPKEQLAEVDDIAKLVAMGPEKGKYLLLDSRPPNMYAEGHIPTAVSMPFSAFDKLANELLKDKETLQIYYCAGYT
ncbi:rhodanese-like domain-containing protein [Desulfomonile tiedjei]|nr:rhodanese-like domain-containing protein [Desulfomonile tiedjei]